MSHKYSLANKSYLAITTLISAGVLSGCEYCIPVLSVLLIIPVLRYLADFSSATQLSVQLT